MILLDTHAFYWFIRDDEKMPAKVKELIETEEKVFEGSGICGRYFKSRLETIS